jgi:hypothetical protein
MSGQGVVVGVLAVLMGVWCLILIPRVWRGYLTRGETLFRGRQRTHGEFGLLWWPFGEATRSGAVRAFVAGTFWWCALTIFYWASYQGGTSGSTSTTWHVITWAFAALSFVWFALALTVMFFNWPKFIVPPGQRGEPGAAAKWRKTRQPPRIS